ncbi:MAG: hypothetical protein GY943_13845 [Chloroflexi bacterium]|nr:hypothetical protein [Chloroflexota bacterium]
MSRNISYAITGWLAGVVTTLVMGFVWPTIFPAIVNVEHYYGDGPSLITIIGIVLLVMSPASLVGGIIGGRLSIEGGEGSQRMIAAIFGILFTLPFACVVFLFFTGFGFGIS